MKKIIGCIKKADNDYSMIEDGDIIGVGVSGGKDSIALLYGLHLYQRTSKINFKVIGIHIEMGFAGMDFSETDEFCQKNNIELHHEPSQVYEILKKHPTNSGELPCSLCSTFKKGLVIDTSKKYHCTKVAFAHHSDDAVETLFMNMVYGGKINTFTPTMYLDRTDTNFIRPLIYAYESDIIQAVESANLPVVPSTCPADKHTKREEFKTLLNEIYKTYPQAKKNLLTSLSNEEQILLWHKNPKKKNQE